MGDEALIYGSDSALTLPYIMVEYHDDAICDSSFIYKKNLLWLLDYFILLGNEIMISSNYVTKFKFILVV